MLTAGVDQVSWFPGEGSGPSLGFCKLPRISVGSGLDLVPS
jgi:hypothetical protein